MKYNRYPQPLFYHAQAATEDHFVIEGEEAQHMLASRRFKAGDIVYLTDGNGGVCQGVIEEIAAKRQAAIKGLRYWCDLPTRIEIILACALPKKDRIQNLLDQASQLGVTTFIPLDCERSVMRYQHKQSARWQRIVTNSAKQCLRSRFMVLNPAMSLADLCVSMPKEASLLYGDVSGESIFNLDSGIIARSEQIFLVVGPEGGFTADEYTLLDELSSTLNIGCLSLAPHILRTETAAAAMVAALQQKLAVSLSE